MPSVADNLTAKIGPLPVWVWGVGAGAAINIGRVIYKRTRPAPSTDETAADDPAADASATGSGAGSVSVSAPDWNASGVGNPGGWNPSPDPVSPTGPDTPTGPVDNAQWRSLAVEQLVAAGYGPVIVDEALKRYLAGSPLTAQDQAIVALAIRRLGVPPDGAPPITSAPEKPTGSTTPPGTTPAPAPTPTKPVGSVTVGPGDTLWGLVTKRDGKPPTRARIDAVAAFNGLRWNAAHDRVSPWAVGQIVKFPPA